MPTPITAPHNIPSDGNSNPAFANDQGISQFPSAEITERYQTLIDADVAAAETAENEG